MLNAFRAHDGGEEPPTSAPPTPEADEPPPSADELVEEFGAIEAKRGTAGATEDEDA
jgi:hypothetical protein